MFDLGHFICLTLYIRRNQHTLTQAAYCQNQRQWNKVVKTANYKSKFLLVYRSTTVSKAWGITEGWLIPGPGGVPANCEPATPASTILMNPSHDALGHKRNFSAPAGRLASWWSSILPGAGQPGCTGQRLGRRSSSQPARGTTNSGVRPVNPALCN